MQRSEQINELAAALAKAQGAIEGAKKDSVNPHFKSAYADLAAVWEAVRQPLTTNGLAVAQWPRTMEGGVEIETVLMHTSGQYMSDVLWLPVLKMDAQGVGSAVSYGRRYALMAVLGVAAIDDDGNGATDAHKPGAPGSAAGGTDFRPAGPRRMPTSNWVDDAMNDGIVDQERTKGTLPLKPANGNGKPPAPTAADRAEKIAVRAREYVDRAVNTLKLSGQTTDSIKRFLADNHSEIQFLEAQAPAQHDRLFETVNAVLESANARVPF